MKLLDGKALAAGIRAEIKEEIRRLHLTPGLAVLLVGQDPASKIYVRHKRKACEEVGIFSEEHSLPETTSEVELIAQIHRLNDNPAIHGILVQLPLPGQIHERFALSAVLPEKDVDGLHPVNMGKLVSNEEGITPCTPLGILRLIQAADVAIAGSYAVIVGRSNIVGKPTALLLLHQHATVTICHSRTKNIHEICRRADILVAALGKPRFITKEMVKEGAVVIDVGVNRQADGTLVGDVDFEPVSQRVSAITPVPGGVGPMTVAMLLVNTLKSAKASPKTERAEFGTPGSLANTGRNML